MDRDQFQKAVVPLDHVLDESGWTVDRDRAANHLLVRRLMDQRELRLDRVDAVCDLAAQEGRDLKQSEKREATRLQAEVDAFDEVIDETREILDDPKRHRRQHLAATAGIGTGGLGGTVSRVRSPLSLELPETITRDVRDAILDRQTVSRQLSAAQLDSSTPTPLPSRGRLADYVTVRAGTTPSSAFLSTTAVTPAAVVAEGAPKPAVATTALVSAPHQKLAGYIDVSREEIVYGGDVASAIEGIAARQLISAENTAIATALAGATAVAAGTTPAQSLLA